jgi:hypothetical protein
MDPSSNTQRQAASILEVVGRITEEAPTWCLSRTNKAADLISRLKTKGT